MDDVREDLETLLADDPSLRERLEAVRRIDAAEATWTFDDIPLDSGQFGELVARGIAEEHGDGYRLADTEAVAAVLAGDGGTDGGAAGWSVAGVNRRVAGRVRLEAPGRLGLLAGTLGLLVGFRLFGYPAVFRDGVVVLSANDPYLYRYWVEQLLAIEASWGATIAGLPPEMATGEPLLVVTLWGVSRLAGATPAAAGVVLAWYPVVASVGCGVGLYLVAERLFADGRVSLAAVAMFAITPVAAYRASLGFADHHAFDYLWQVLVILGLVFVVAGGADRSPRHRSGAVALLGVALAGQTLAWDNSPILLAPLGVYGAVLGVSAVATDRSPVRAALPLLAGMGLGAGLTWLAHTTLGWHGEPVAIAPAVVLVGVAGVTAVAEAGHRLGLSTRGVAVAVLGAVLVGGLGLPRVLPAAAARLVDRVGFLLSDRAIVETTGLFAEQVGTVVGPLFLFGFVLFLGLPYLGWLSWRAAGADRPGWLVVATYAWVFLGLAVIQIRFAGQLAPSLAIVAGLGFVHLASVVEVARRPAVFQAAEAAVGEWRPAWPGGRRVAALGVLVLLVASASLVQTPVKTSQLTHEKADFETAAWMADDAADRELGYPDSYVFSRWDHTRLYNYFVNGQARSYSFAQEHYRSFIYSTGEGGWYDRLDERVGYVVIEGDERYEAAPPTSMYARLADPRRGRPHFRAVYRSPTGENVVYRLVPGARLTWAGSAGESMEISTRVEIPGAVFTYTRTVTPDASGRYSVVVPYPGTYRVGDRRVEVSEAAVVNGSTV